MLGERQAFVRFRSGNFASFYKMETEERPAKIQKLEEATDLETSKQHSTGIFQDLQSQTEHMARGLPGSRLENLPEHEDKKADIDSGYTGLSKNAMKRLIKRQEWEAGRDFRKIKRKERLIAKRERLKLKKTDLEASGTNGQNVHDTVKTKARKPVSVPLTFLLDCGFDEQMHDKEIVSIGGQLTRCYSENRNASYQPTLAISSFSGRLKTRFDTVLREMQARWRSVRFEEDDFVAVAEKAKQWMREDQFSNFTECPALKTNADVSSESGEVVYLTADSDETLEELRPYSVYIIGGIVDRNRHKGICYRRAMDRGIKTAKLPIGTYMQMNSRAVLATNHVYEIMLKWLELKDWGEAFMQVIPKRKGGVLKDQDMQGSNHEDQEVASEDLDDCKEAVIEASVNTDL